MNQSNAIEANFDCLVGPTHHFGGLSLGNLASTSNKARLAKPKMAALQGLKKMRFLSQKGFVQGILPPHPRPYLKGLRNLGFCGSDQEIIKNAIKNMPQIFKSLCSSSFMWAANAATVSPKWDSRDQKTHITVANLSTMFHRSIEHEFAYSVFKKIFSAEQFMVHEALLAHDLFSDEGAANHNRLSPTHGQKGLEIFVWGKESSQLLQKTRVFVARQSALANEALIRRHALDPKYALNIEQNPEAIDAGAFHNDVVAVSNENVFLCHEKAFSNQKKTLDLIQERYQKLFVKDPFIIEVKEQDLSLADTVKSYLFNSQLLTKKDGSMLLFSPADCLNGPAEKVIRNICNADNPINEVEFFDISESMANGGGPACLRLRMVLDQHDLASIGHVLFTEEIFEKLSAIIEKYYVDELTIEHFYESSFLENCRDALNEMAKTLGLSSIYEF